MASRSIESPEISEFIKDVLIEKSTDPVRWQTIYEDPRSGELWLLDYPNASYHGGGLPRLRSLPLDRMALLEMLLRNLHLNVSERQQLVNGSALESELAELIESEFRRNGWYPAERRPWLVNGSVYEGHILERIDQHVTRLWCQRDSPIASGNIVQQTQATFNTVREAVHAFIRREWPDQQIDGIRIVAG
jgi:hypothetical protein